MSHAQRPTASGLARLPLFRATAYPGFPALWLNALLSALAMWLETVAVGWMVLDLTGSPFVLGFVAFVRGVPLLVLAPIGGVVADRVDRRKLIGAILVIDGVVAGVLAALIFTGNVAVWHLIVWSLVGGGSIALLAPAQQALTYDVVGREGFTNAVSLFFMARSATRVAGPAAGGVIIATVGAEGCFALMALGWIGAGLVLAKIPRPSAPQPVGSSSPWQNLKEGLRYVRGSQVLLLLLLSEIMADGFGFSGFVLLPVFARDILQVGPEGLGLLVAAPGVGAALTALVTGWLGYRLHRRRGRVLLGGMGVFGLSWVAFSLSGSFPFSLAILALVGVGSTIFDTLEVTCLQSAVSDELRGRVMGLYVLGWSATNLGSLQSGTLASYFGAPVTVALTGAILFGYSGLLALFAPKVRDQEG